MQVFRFIRNLLILPLLSLAALGSAGHAQEFLTCAPEGTTIQGAVSRESWIRHSRAILHQLGGDDVQAFFGFSPRLEIIPVPMPNAFAVGRDTITLSAGLLESTASSAELAFVLAHEAGHLAMAHGEHVSPLVRDSTISSRIRSELAADRYAVTLLRAGGFDPAAGIALLTRLRGHVIDHGLDSEMLTPSLGVRLAALEGRIPPS